MSPTTTQPPPLKLSICIPTFNRAGFIGETLRTILCQITEECEVVVLDGASTDDTERVVSEYLERFNRLRYIRQGSNNGIDRDYDRVVELARGEYCWLMTDDDLLKPGAGAAVLQSLRRNVSLVIVNTELRDFSMSQVLQRRCLDFEEDRVYGPKEMDRLFVDISGLMKYVGCVVIKRAIWLAREKERYFGSLFLYLGVIFQERLPSEMMVIAEPFISYRMGNTHTFTSIRFETSMVSLPSLVWSLALSDATKSTICGPAPWKNFQELLIWRARGSYSLTEYHQCIHPLNPSVREKLMPILVALLPGVLVNALYVLYYSVTRHSYRGMQPDVVLGDLKQSRFYFRNWRGFKRT
jgi:abequosyltransferase